jgi:hypothetical protein
VERTPPLIFHLDSIDFLSVIPFAHPSQYFPTTDNYAAYTRVPGYEKTSSHHPLVVAVLVVLYGVKAVSIRMQMK